MKKSPLSMPSGSRGRGGYGWKSQNPRNNRTGYGSVTSDNYQCISSNTGQMQYGDEFLPLNVSTPEAEQNRQGGNWYGAGNPRQNRYSGNGGYNNYRNNYHTSPKSSYNNSYSPYKHSGKPFHGQRKAYQKDAHRHVDISNYIDMRSVLEDPWAALMSKLDSSQATGTVASSPDAEFPVILNSCHRGAKASLNDSEFSQESKNDSSLDLPLGLDDSTVSRADSSVDLQLDAVKVNEDSMTEKDKHPNESNSRDNQAEDIVCDTQPDIPRVSI